MFIPAVSLSCWRLTLHPSVLPSIPPSLYPPILVWSFVPQQRGKASDDKRPCVCVCLQSHWLHGRNKMFSLFLLTWASPSHFCDSAMYSFSWLCFNRRNMWGALYLTPIPWCSSAANPQKSSTASHRHSHTHKHTRRSTVDSLLLCQGISHDQSQSFVSPGVKKVKTERRRRLEGNVVGFRAYKLSWQSRNVPLQDCTRNTDCDPCHLFQLFVISVN